MKGDLSKFRAEFRKQSAVAIIAAFGFLIALSWRDFISAVVNNIVAFVNNVQSVYLLKFLAALIVTVVSIIGIMLASKLNVRAEEEKQKKKTRKKK